MPSPGIDIGTGADQGRLFRVGGQETCLAKRVERIRQRDPWSCRRGGLLRRYAEGPAWKAPTSDCATTGEGEALEFPYRPLLFDDDACARRRSFMATRSARRPRHRRVARPRHPHGRARQGAQLQDDQPVRVRLRPVPREHRALPRHRPGRNRLAVQTGRQSRGGVGICAVLAETDVINMVSRGITAPNIPRASTSGWPVAWPSCSSRSARAGVILHRRPGARRGPAQHPQRVG